MLKRKFYDIISNLFCMQLTTYQIRHFYLVFQSESKRGLL